MTKIDSLFHCISGTYIARSLALQIVDLRCSMDGITQGLVIADIPVWGSVYMHAMYNTYKY